MNGLEHRDSPVRLLRPRRFEDARGWFMETYSETAAEAAGIQVRFVQDNQSLSVSEGTVRGLHFQTPPHAQAKLVRCVRGAMMDYAVDLRAGSPTYGRWVSAELSADNGCQLYLPVGFAHGFVTLRPNTEIAYKCSAPYDAGCDAGLSWDDPDIGIDWPLPPTGPVLSDKDRALPGLAGFDSPFPYDGRPLERVGGSL